MSIESALGDVLKRELEEQLVPLRRAVQRMEEGLEALDLLRSVTYRLEPLSSRLGALAGITTPAPARGGGRRRKVAGKAPAARTAAPPTARATTLELPLGDVRPVKGAGKRARAAEGSRACAVVGCKRPSRSKGYCSAHYQKLRLLIRTGRRPAEWVDDAEPQSVEEVKLPRGRAASKALAEAAESQSTAEAKPARKGARKAASKKSAAKKSAAKKAPKAKRAAKVARKAPAAKKPKASARKKGGRKS